jgi:Peptidase_C39 like family
VDSGLFALLCENTRVVRRLNFTLLLALAFAFLAGCQTRPDNSNSTSGERGQFSHFIGVTDFSGFARTASGDGRVVLLSPPITPAMSWNQLVVSWNASAPAGTFLEVAAAANINSPRGTTRFYSLGRWTPDDQLFPRASVSGQKDADGQVDVDTLVLNHAAGAVQIRLTMGGTNGALPAMKFLGLSFCNTRWQRHWHSLAITAPHAAWGKVLPVVERSQQSYAGGNGWCSPTSLSMALSYWGSESNRADWKLDAPEVAAGVIDHNFKKATGNWAFNTAYAGGLNGMRAYVTRFNNISELEEWIAAGIPVVISARYDLLQDGRKPDFNGHLTVCRGFTDNGDVVINDPWTDLKVESVRHIYKRENVARAWATSHNTVYLVYPETVKPPPDRFGHWFDGW